jgi:hypothetical protein
MGMWRNRWLSCSGCAERFDFPDGGHVYQYTDLTAPASFDDTVGHCWPVLDLPCWCIDCNRPSYCERIPSLDDIMKAAAVQRIPEGPRRHEIDDELLYLEPEVLRHFAVTFSSRVSRPRCLVCGGAGVVAFDEWKKETPLRHDACGSELEHHARFMSAIGRREFRYYTPEGDLVWVATGVA